jgi:hypothetical protein
MTNPPMGEPAYTPPQDPWAGTQGMAATPTDPIPQPPVVGQYAPGIASPPSWSADTISHTDQYDYVPQPRRRTGRYVLVVLVVLLLGVGGGYGAWYLITNRYNGSTPLVQGSTPPASVSTTSTRPPAVALGDLKQGDCIQDLNPGGDPYMVLASCDKVPTYKILKIYRDLDAPANPDDKNSYLPIYHDKCGDLPQANSWYYLFYTETKKIPYFFCTYFNGPASS